MERERILKIRDLTISFKTGNGKVNAIRGVNFDLYKGETVAIVGESGSGKSVTTKAIMGILANNGSIDSGSIEYTWHDEYTGEAIFPRSNDFFESNNDDWKTNHGTNDVSLWKIKRRSLSKIGRTP